MYSRIVDELGRIALPLELRNELNIRSGDKLSVFLTAECITISKKVQGCLFCNSGLVLVKIGERYVCRNCINRLTNAKEGDIILDTNYTHDTNHTHMK